MVNHQNGLQLKQVFHKTQLWSSHSAFFKLMICHKGYVVMQNYPVDTGRKLNVHTTFRRRPRHLLNVLCTFNLRPVSTGQLLTTLHFSQLSLSLYYNHQILMKIYLKQHSWLTNGKCRLIQIDVNLIRKLTPSMKPILTW